MNEHTTRESIDYQRGRRDGYNEGFAGGIKAAQRFIETHTGPIVIPLADRNGVVSLTPIPNVRRHFCRECYHEWNCGPNCEANLNKGPCQAPYRTLCSNCDWAS